MTLKHTITGEKNWGQPGHTGFSATDLFGKLWKSLKFEVPVGYQDEKGFHYGVKSAPGAFNSPQV